MTRHNRTTDDGTTSAPNWSSVIAGFRTPETPAELLELIRIVLDTCTPLLASPGDAANELEVSFENGRLATVKIDGEPE